MSTAAHIVGARETSVVGTMSSATSSIAVERNPQQQPHETQCSSRHERPLPTPCQRNPRYEQRGEDGPRICARVEDSRRKRAFSLRKPLCDCLDRTRENRRLAEPEKSTRE